MAVSYTHLLWGLPYYGHVGIMMYRKDWFEEKGITVPVNTDELMAAAEKFTDKANNKFGIAMRAIKGEDNLSLIHI